MIRRQYIDAGWRRRGSRHEDAEAAAWAERAARAPGAHVLIAMIATAAHALKGDMARAGWWAANVRGRSGTLSRQDFFGAFPMTSQDMRGWLSEALGRFDF